MIFLPLIFSMYYDLIYLYLNREKKIKTNNELTWSEIRKSIAQSETDWNDFLALTVSQYI